MIAASIRSAARSMIRLPTSLERKDSSWFSCDPAIFAWASCKNGYRARSFVVERRPHPLSGAQSASIRGASR